MPTYEYECKKCRYNFEVFQSINDEPLKDCPKCGKEVRRLIFGGAGVIFKGSGFYVTDKGKSPPGSKTRPADPGAGRPPKDGEAKDGQKPAETASTAAEGVPGKDKGSKGKKHVSSSESAKQTA